jgi:antitoxin PrlF
MAKKKIIPSSCCSSSAGAFKVEALLGVDERGQMVLPKELREKAGIAPGDRLAVVSWVKDNDICCLSLIKADYLTGMVKEFLGPLVSGLSGTSKTQ